MKLNKLFSLVLAVVLLLTSTVTAFAADAAVPADVQPVKSYTATVGKAYRLPEELRQTGDTYATSDSNILAVERDTGAFAPVSGGIAYIVADNAGQKRYVKVTVKASSPQTWEEKVNALTLHPARLEDITGEGAAYVMEDYYNRYMSLVKPEMTNYEILRAVYDYVVKNYRTNTLKRTNIPAFFQCTGYATELCQALCVVGFEVRSVGGECTVKGGGWTSHAWSAIKVGDELLYLDANIPAEHGGNPDVYFATVPANMPFYRNARSRVFEMAPNLEGFAVYDEGDRPDWLEW